MIHLKQGPWSQQDGSVGKALVPEPEDLSSDPSKPHMEGENQHPKVVP